MTIARHTEIAALPAYGIAGEVNRVLAERGCVIEACDLRGDELSEFLSSVLN